MKIIKKSNSSKFRLVLSKKEFISIGRKTGWLGKDKDDTLVPREIYKELGLKDGSDEFDYLSEPDTAEDELGNAEDSDIEEEENMPFSFEDLETEDDMSADDNDEFGPDDELEGLEDYEQTELIDLQREELERDGLEEIIDGEEEDSLDDTALSDGEQLDKDLLDEEDDILDEEDDILDEEDDDEDWEDGETSLEEDYIEEPDTDSFPTKQVKTELGGWLNIVASTEEIDIPISEDDLESIALSIKDNVSSLNNEADDLSRSQEMKDIIKDVIKLEIEKTLESKGIDLNFDIPEFHFSSIAVKLKNLINKE